MAPESPAIRKLIRRLVDREKGPGDAPDAGASAAVVACERTYRELSRWLGAEGTLALFTRALAEARAQHPALAEIRLASRSEPALEGVPESVRKHGEMATAESLEALLVTLLELLGRLIGDDMVMRLMEQDRAPGEPGPGGQKVAP